MIAIKGFRGYKISFLHFKFAVWQDKALFSSYGKSILYGCFALYLKKRLSVLSFIIQLLALIKAGSQYTQPLMRWIGFKSIPT